MKVGLCKSLSDAMKVQCACGSLGFAETHLHASACTARVKMSLNDGPGISDVVK
jgi:hypothetical protein